jgi:pteridine reductase
MSHGHPVALITGAARRLGAAIAHRLHEDGYDIALHYRESMDQATALAAQFNAIRPRSALLLRAELTELDRLPGLVDDAVGHFGRLDALVNNASTFFPTPFGTTTTAQWETLFAANVRAPYFLAQAAAPHLKQTSGGIVNLADIHGERPLRDHAVYGMAKAALIHMTRALALELAPQVRVNAVAPGAILWAESDSALSSAAQAAVLARTPLARIGTPREIAEAVRWLLREATYTTGQIIRVDGGRLLEA